jgi:hypothetical protein
MAMPAPVTSKLYQQYSQDGVNRSDLVVKMDQELKYETFSGLFDLGGFDCLFCRRERDDARVHSAAAGPVGWPAAKDRASTGSSPELSQSEPAPQAHAR